MVVRKDRSSKSLPDAPKRRLVEKLDCRRVYPILPKRRLFLHDQFLQKSPFGNRKETHLWCQQSSEIKSTLLEPEGDFLRNLSLLVFAEKSPSGSNKVDP
jgi:hypothetical protein